MHDCSKCFMWLNIPELNLGISEWYYPIFKKCTCCKKNNWRIINAIASNWGKNMLRHLSFQVSSSYLLGKLFASRKTVRFSENCSLLGTGNVCKQISKHIFTPNGGYCLYISTWTCKNNCSILGVFVSPEWQILIFPWWKRGCCLWTQPKNFPPGNEVDPLNPFVTWQTSIWIFSLWLHVAGKSIFLCMSCSEICWTHVVQTSELSQILNSINCRMFCIRKIYLFKC